MREAPQRARHEDEVYGGTVHAVVDAFNADDRFDNDLTSKLTVQGPSPALRRASFLFVRPPRTLGSFP
jgi:hypothetical protein